jgi:hypothetical protein
MVRITIRKKAGKKGQLFLIEVFIALTVLILLMAAVYRVEFTTVPNYRRSLSLIGYDALDSMNQAGELKPYVYNNLTTQFTTSLEDILPENILWRMSVEDESNVVQFSIYWNRVPPTDGSVGVTEYFLYGFETNLEGYRIIHLELWYLVE